MHTRISFQLVLTSFSFEPEIDLKALVQCLLPLVQDCSQSTTAAQGNLIAIHLKILEQHDGIAQKHGGMIEQHGGITQEHGGIAQEHGGMIEQHCGIAQDCGLNNLWGGCLTRPDGQDAHPTKCAVYLISIPQKHCGIIEQHYMITANRRKSLQSYSYS